MKDNLIRIKDDLIRRLTTYAAIDTQSDESSESCPSTPGQWDLLRLLETELKELGLSDVTLDGNGYLMATLPANTDKADVPVIGFLAHVDTATDMTGKNVKPQVVDSYDGGDIVLNEALGVVLSPREFPELAGYKGHTLITTDGTTLLGADDKAGIAEIMTAMEHLLRHPEIKHGKLRVAFTPDEEIGRGPERFDVAAFGAKFAYTMDGGPLGELQYESFNACGAKLTVKGKNVHPGSAKNKMVNALKLAIEVPEPHAGGRSAGVHRRLRRLLPPRLRERRRRGSDAQLPDPGSRPGEVRSAQGVHDEADRRAEREARRPPDAGAEGSLL